MFILSLQFCGTKKFIYSSNSPISPLPSINTVNHCAPREACSGSLSLNMQSQISFFTNSFFFLILRPGPSQKFTAQFEPVYFKSLIQVLSIQCPSSQFLLTIHEKNLIIFIGKAKPICFSLLTLNHTRSFHILLAYPIPAHTGDWVHCVPPVPWYFHLSSRSEQALLSTSIFDLAKFKNLFIFSL